MNLAQVQELFIQAVTDLAEAPGAIQQRLNRAFTSLSQVDAEGLAPELAARVAAINTAMGSTPVSRVMMTDDAGRALARDIVAVAFQMCRPT